MFFRGFGDGKYKWGRVGSEDTLLQNVQLESQNLPELTFPERLEHHDLIYAVHKLGCKFAPGGFHSCTCDFVCCTVVQLPVLVLSLDFRSGESQIGSQNGTHLPSAEITGHENHGPGEVHAAVV